MSNNITLSQLASMADDAWLNEPVVGVARLIAQKTSKAGKPFWQLSLTDKDDPSAPEVAFTLFQDASRYDGKLVSIEGKGNKKTSYNGKPQINVGKTGIIKVLGGSAAPSPASSHAGRLPTPAAAPAANRPAFSADGAKIGGCVARAVEYIVATNAELTEDNIVSYAGIALRATTRLEQGEWAQQSSQPMRRPQPGPNGQSHNNDAIDEDVPF